MRIVVNGRPVDVRDPLTLQDLLDELGVRRPFTAAALNGAVVPRAGHGSIVLREGDRVEIVHPMAGGSDAAGG